MWPWGACSCQVSQRFKGFKVFKGLKRLEGLEGFKGLRLANGRLGRP